MQRNDASPEQIAQARALYADPAVPIAHILAVTGLTKTMLYRVLDGDGGTLPPIPRRARSTRRKRRRAVDRTAVVKRIWAAADQEVRDIEERLARSQLQPRERAGEVRNLAVLVKALRELATLDEANGAKDAGTADDDEGPRDIDEFRRDLARRMQAFRESRTNGGVSGD